MAFGAVQEQEVGNTKLLVLTGRWSAKTLKELFGVEDPTKAVLPEYIPEYVRIYVDASAMLPRRIQYLKKHPNPEQKSIRPLTTLDLRNINLQADLPDDTFVFPRPKDKDVKEVDLTSQVIESIRKMAADKKEAAEDGDNPSTDDSKSE